MLGYMLHCSVHDASLHCQFTAANLCRPERPFDLPHEPQCVTQNLRFRGCSPENGVMATSPMRVLVVAVFGVQEPGVPLTALRAPPNCSTARM